MIDYRSYAHNLCSFEIKPEKNSGLTGIRTQDLCEYQCSALPTELSSQQGAGDFDG